MVVSQGSDNVRKEEISKVQEEERLLNSLLYPDLVIEEDVVEDIAENLETQIFYLWENHRDIYNIFMVIRLYLDEYNGVDSGILIPLLQEKALPLQSNLLNLAYILNGYISVITPRASDNGTDRPNN